jgi:hypothetical protein
MDFESDHNIMRKKLLLYEKFFEEMKKIEEEERMNKEDNGLNTSVIIEKDLEGNRNKKIPSNLSESFLVVDKGKDLTQLNQKEQNAINEQNNLHNYNEIKKYGQKASIVTNILGYVISIGKWFAIL